MGIVLKYTLSTILLLFLVYGIVGAQIENLNAAPSGNAIKISWICKAESNIDHFEIYRGLDKAGSFEPIKENIAPHPDNEYYEYIDQSLFKSQDRTFCYKIRIVYNDNSSQESSPVVTSYTSSTAKRTWGSIKAMFR
jgi:hypothetical protein